MRGNGHQPALTPGRLRPAALRPLALLRAGGLWVAHRPEEHSAGLPGLVPGAPVHGACRAPGRRPRSASGTRRAKTRACCANRCWSWSRPPPLAAFGAGYSPSSQPTRTRRAAASPCRVERRGATRPAKTVCRAVSDSPEAAARSRRLIAVSVARSRSARAWLTRAASTGPRSGRSGACGRSFGGRARPLSGLDGWRRGGAAALGRRSAIGHARTVQRSPGPCRFFANSVLF